MSAHQTRPLAIIYTRVSKASRHGDGLSLDMQERCTIEAAEAAGYRVEIIREEGKSAKSLKGRPALREALDRLDRGEAAALYSYALDRLARSVVDFASMMERSSAHGWRITLVSINLDTTTPSGVLLANVMSSIAQYEREIIAKRTRDCLAERRAQGHRLGRPDTLSAEVVGRIIEERQQGRTLRAIAAGLEADRIPTAHGGNTWHAQTISKVLQGQQAAALLAA